MQINNSLLNSLTDWSGGNSTDSTEGNGFMQTLGAALSPDVEKQTAQQAAQLVSALSGRADAGKAGLTSSDAMFAALTQNMMQTMVQDALTPPQTQAEAGATDTATAFSDGGVPGFGDVLDIVNPLQHIPVVSQYYRDWTGDDMGYISQVAGGAFWGGGVGIAASFVNLGLTSVMGQSPTQYMQQFFAGDEAATAGSNNGALSNSPVSNSSSATGTSSTTARSPISS